MKTKLTNLALGMLLSVAITSSTHAAETIPVTVETFIRAESDLYMGVVALKEGGLGKFEHHREMAPIDAHTIIP